MPRDRVRFRAAGKLFLGFLAAIAAGTILLVMPFAAREEPLALVDALFTATSSVCVTGLIVKDTGSDFTLFGKIVILVLIQLGGLGIITVSTLTLLALRRKARMLDRLSVESAFSPEFGTSVRDLVIRIVRFTLFVELLGAALLYIRFSDDHGPWAGVLPSIFHSVSAFCNAGFCLYSDSLARYANDGLVSGTIGALVLMGGIGFPVILELFGRVVGRRRRLSLHTKLVLWMSGGLLFAGFAFFWLVESGNVLAGAEWSQQVLCSFFQSVTPRTAGFSTVSFSEVRMATLVFFCGLMFIGGSPGSAAGGLKTTTLAVLVSAIYSRMRGKRQIEIGRRTIGSATAIKAALVVLLALIFLFVVVVILSLTEGEIPGLAQDHSRFLSLMFEVFSAFGTVGLSAGLTAVLSATGKVVLCVVMLIGRLGPLTFAQLIVREQRPARYQYPEEPVMIG